MEPLRLLVLLAAAYGCEQTLDAECDGTGATSLIQRSLTMSRIPRWVGKGGNALHTGFSDVHAPKHLSKGSSWNWTAPRNLSKDMQGIVHSSPIIDSDGSIYLSTDDGITYKFSKHGKVLWTFDAKMKVPSNPVLDQHLYICRQDCTFIALDPEKGEEIWRLRAGGAHGPDTSSLVAADGLVMGACLDEGDKKQFGGATYVTAVSSKGEPKWSYRTESDMYNWLGSVVDDSVFFADSFGGTYRLKLKSGEQVWHVPSPPNMDMTTGGLTGGAHGIFYVTSNHANPNGGKIGILTAIDMKGKKLWEKRLQYGANSGAAIGQRGGKDFVVVAIGPNPSLLMAPGLIVDLDSLDGPKGLLKGQLEQRKPSKAIAFDAKTGEQIWSFDFPEWHGVAAGESVGHICLPDSYANPAVAGDGSVYFAGESGTIFRVLDEDGDGKIGPKEVESFETFNAFQGAPALSDGILAISPCNGLHVFLE